MTHHDPLPTFRYHPDSVATGTVDDIQDAIRPWRLADGSAHARFGAEFNDIGGIGGYNDGGDPVPRAVAEEVAYRTPGFATWRAEPWWTHCGDAAAFLGPAGFRELSNEWRAAVDVIRRDGGYDRLPDDDWEQLLRAFDRDGSPTAYVFRCRHCGRLG